MKRATGRGSQQAAKKACVSIKQFFRQVRSFTCIASHYPCYRSIPPSNTSIDRGEPSHADLSDSTRDDDDHGSDSHARCDDLSDSPGDDSSDSLGDDSSDTSSTAVHSDTEPGTPQPPSNTAVNSGDFGKVVQQLKSNRILTENEKFFLLTNHFVPPRNFNFPCRLIGGVSRHFQWNWLGKFNGLVYSEYEATVSTVYFLLEVVPQIQSKRWVPL